ncbi:hypothetical protein GCM10027416_12650 [Okibacterium endophyticum]
MVAQLLGMRLRMLANVFRRSPSQLIGIVVLALAGITLLVLIGGGVIALQSAPAEFARNVIVIVGCFVVLGFVLVPLVFGHEDDLDPRAFSLFGIRPRLLARNLFIASLVTVPSVVLVILTALTIVTWGRGFFAVLCALIGGALAVATCVLASRLTSAVASLVLATRRSRELMGIFGVVLIVLVAPAVILLSSIDVTADGFSALRSAADAISWTPLGAAWAIPGDIAGGSVGAALLKLLIAAATVGLLWLAWERVVTRMMVTTERPSAPGTAVRRGWFDVFPATRSGVVAARSMTYWARDSRYLVSIIIIPLAPLLMIGALLVAGVPLQPLTLLPLPVIALFLGWSLHNDLALDSTAIWMHVAAGVRGVADRIGRTVPVLIIGVPVVVVGSMLSVVLYGDWVVLPSVFGVAACLLLAGLGVSSVSSARFPYPAVQPGDSPFQQPQTSGTNSGLVQSIALVGTIALALPTLIYAWLGLVEDASWHTVALWVGVGTGLVVYLLGVWIGGRVFERRGPEIMAFATSM